MTSYGDLGLRVEYKTGMKDCEIKTRAVEDEVGFLMFRIGEDKVGKVGEGE